MQLNSERAFDVLIVDDDGQTKRVTVVAVGYSQGRKVLFTPDGRAWTPRTFGSHRCVRLPEHDRQLDAEDKPTERRRPATRDPHTPL